MPKVLMIVAQDGYQPHEYGVPRRIFADNNCEVKVAAKEKKTARDKVGGSIEPDLALNEVDASKFDAVVFVGGPGAAQYFNDQQALVLAKTAYDQGKVIAAICIGPSILANAGILTGKKATVFPSEAENLKAKGANVTGHPVETDGKIVTANGPDAAEEFGEKIVELVQS